jgi:L-ascorbate metabolism protein UlaG (beta-lactamase superfamily)
MEIQLIRNATMRIRYHHHLFVTDPFLAAKHTARSFAGISKNPLVDLPCTPEEVVSGVEMALISHLHNDHFDALAQELLSKTIPIFCQPGDETQIADKGFQEVMSVKESVTWQGFSLTRTPAQHGTGEWIARMGNVSGFVLQAADEPTVYWAGNTIWYEAVEQVLAAAQPDIIIIHSSGAKFGDSDPIVMDAAQTIAVCQAAPSAIVVAIHLDSLDHGTVSRADLRALAQQSGISPERLRIPADGETLNF